MHLFEDPIPRPGLIIMIPLWNPTLEQMKYWYDLSLSNSNQIFVLVHDCRRHVPDSMRISYIHYDFHGFHSHIAKNFYVLMKFGWKGIPSSLTIAAEFLVSLKLTWLDNSFILVLDQDTKVNSSPFEDSLIPFLSSNTISYPGNSDIFDSKIGSFVRRFSSLPWRQWSGSVIPFTYFVDIDPRNLPHINHSDLFFMIKCLQSGYLFAKIPSFSIEHIASPDRRVRIFGQELIVPSLSRSFMALCASIKSFVPLLLRTPSLIFLLFFLVCLDLVRFVLSLLRVFIFLVFGGNVRLILSKDI